MAGEILSFEVLDSSPLDSDGSIGINGSGWVGLVRLADISDDAGALDASKLTLTVSDPGFNSDGTPSTVTRQIYGVAHLRRQWPNGNQRMIFADGGDLLIHVTLSDWIYDGSTIVSVEIADGFYPGVVPGAPASISNNSEREYPEPVWAWINPQNERTGLTHEIEGVAFHRHGRNGQQVACVGYIVSDGINSANEIIVSAPELSERVKQGNIPETWRGVLDMSEIDQGEMAAVNVRIYPWIGLAYDMSVSGVAWPTAAPMTTLRVFCDKTGAYGGGYAYVQAGATGGAASDDPGTAKLTPFPTYNTAAVGLQAWNNANRGHNDLGGGTIRFMDDGAGGPQNHSISGNITNAPGQTWCVIEADPDTEAEVSFTVTANSRSPNLCHWRNLTHLIGAIGYNWSGQNELASMICVENCVVDNTENRSVIARYDYKYLIGVTAVGGRLNINDLPTPTAIPASLIGCVGENTSAYCRTMIGNIMPGYEINTGGTAREFMIEGGHVLYNNRVKSGFFRNTGTPAVMNHGVANVQNLYEKTVDAGVICMNFFADSDLTEINNYLDLHNTSVGDRASRMYNDEAQTQIAPAGMQKIATSKYSLYDNFNVKVDNFRDAGGGSVGAFAYSYSVGNDGNVNLFGAAQRQTTQVPSNSATDARLGNAWLPTAEPNLTRPEIGMSWAEIMDMFADYTVAPRDVSTGGGDYRPLADAAPLLNRVAAGHSILGYDQGGAPRKTDGTGAAGAFEALQDVGPGFEITDSPESVRRGSSFSVTGTGITSEPTATLSSEPLSVIGYTATEIELEVPANTLAGHGSTVAVEITVGVDTDGFNIEFLPASGFAVVDLVSPVGGPGTIFEGMIDADTSEPISAVTGGQVVYSEMTSGGASPYPVTVRPDGWPEIDTGGATLDGSEVFSFQYLAPGEAMSNSATISLSDYLEPFEFTGSGGITLGGTAELLHAFAATGSGGLTVGGSAEYSFPTAEPFEFTGTGGLVFSGSADYSGPTVEPFDFTGSGGLSVGGSADIDTGAVTILPPSGLVVIIDTSDQVIQAADRPLDPYDTEWIIFAWDERIADANVTSSEWVVPSEWNLVRTAQNQEISARGRAFQSVNAALVDVNNAVAGRYVVSNRVHLSDGRQFERSVKIKIREM